MERGNAGVTVYDLTVSYGGGPVLDRLNLVVPCGSAATVMGENGAGKSTLLRCVAGLQEPSSGTVRVFGQVPGEGVDFWRRVAVSSPSPTWYHGLTVREHLELVQVAHGTVADSGRLDDICDSMGLSDLGDRQPHALSSGQRQRFLLAASLVRPSRLLLLDEPEQHLDSAIRGVLAAILADYVAAGGTLLAATHDREFVRGLGATPFVLE